VTSAPDEQQPTAGPDDPGPVTAEPDTDGGHVTGLDDVPEEDAVPEEAAQQPPSAASSSGPGPEGSPASTGDAEPGGGLANQADNETGNQATDPAGDQVSDEVTPEIPPEPAPETADLAMSDALTLAQTELAERTLDLQRLQAEFLNYKRRVERDRELVKQNATFSVLSGLLPVLDDIDRAREHGELEGGFKAIADSLERIVAGLGLTKFGAKGDAFDPNVHEALMHGHSPDVTFTQVDVVAHAGYRIGDRVLRAARVTVLDPES
jgi:molecular chaperone GrpE